MESHGNATADTMLQRNEDRQANVKVFSDTQGSATAKKTSKKKHN